MGHTDDPKDGKAVAQVSLLPLTLHCLTLYTRLYSVQQPSTQLSSCFVGVRYVGCVITRLSVHLIHHTVRSSAEAAERCCTTLRMDTIPLHFDSAFCTWSKCDPSLWSFRRRGRSGLSLLLHSPLCLSYVRFWYNPAFLARTNSFALLCSNR